MGIVLDTRYIYIYIYRERKREREGQLLFNQIHSKDRQMSHASQRIFL